MSAPTLPSLDEVRSFFKRFVENQTKIYENFERAVQNKIQQKLSSDDPKKQKKLEKIQEKYHKKLKKSCENLKKQPAILSHHQQYEKIYHCDSSEYLHHKQMVSIWSY